VDGGGRRANKGDAEDTGQTSEREDRRHQSRARIDRPLAKKIVEGRPYRNKRDLVTRQLLTKEQYDKVKDLIVAKRYPQK